MSARTARSTMTAQVKAGQRIPGIGQYFANVGIARAVFAEPVHKEDQRLGLAVLGLPSLEEESHPILVFPFVFKGSHATLPVTILNSHTCASCPIDLQEVSSTSRFCPVAQKRLSRIKPWVTKQIGRVARCPCAAGEAWSTTSRSRSSV